MQSIFKRYEKKYLITREQYDVLRGILSRHMAPDRYGEYLVQNLYFDTASWDVMRTSIEKPFYKEKMRLRCYGIPNRGSEFFLELKKKHKDVVYKRRIALPAHTLLNRPVRAAVSNQPSQIARELDFYLNARPVSERIFISYQRTALAGLADEGLRVTFDQNILFRTDCLDYTHPDSGHAILPPGKTLMEIKTLGGMPLWLARALSNAEVYPTAFSKCGVGYIDCILNPPEAKVQIERKVQISA